MAWPVLAAAVSAISTVASAREASNEIDAANRRNINNSNAINIANWEYFRQGRGSDGTAILPEYAVIEGPKKIDPETGEELPGDPIPLEPELFGRAWDIYNRYGGGTLEEQRSALEQLLDPASRAIDDAKVTAQSLFDGSRRNQELNDQAVTAEARRQLTRTTNNQALENMRKSLGRIGAGNAAKGFVGGGSAVDQARLGQRSAAFQNAATATTADDIRSASEVAAILSNNDNRMLTNLGLPLEQAERSVSNVGLVDQSLINRLNLGQSVFNQFRLPVQAYEAKDLPNTIPNTAYSQAVSSLGNGLGSLLTNYGLSQTADPLSSIKTTPIVASAMNTNDLA
jgi:hypothetical protein